MTSSDSTAEATPSKYHVQIEKSKGTVIGDNAHVVQHFYDTSSELQVDLTAAEEIYRRQVVEMYKWLNFSGFAHPDLSLANVPLEDIFVRLSLTVEKVIREPVSAEKESRVEQGKRWRWGRVIPKPNPAEAEKGSQAGQGEPQQRERVITIQEPIELGEALSTQLLLVGEPGAGKSTLLRWLAVTFAGTRQQEPNRVGAFADADRLPVLVELGHLPSRYVQPEGGEAPNWIRLLPEYLTAQFAFTNTPPQLLTRALADGRCLLLFDGLDEVADPRVRARLARSLAELARLSPGNRVIIGSRPAGVSESEGALRPQFRHCQIERFTSEDVQRFFRFWYSLDRSLTPEQQREAADALSARVQATPAILQLASTPLLATILVLIWRNEGDLPDRRVDLYERCCRELVERWEASHDVAYQGGILASKDWEDHLRLLAPLAYAIHSQEQSTSATREELVPLLAQALQTVGYANEQTTATQEAKQFLDALGLRSGLLQYLGDGRYSFPHQTFQEYLAARHIAAQPDPKYIDLVMAHLHEAWWQEVHLLTIAHLGSGSAEASKASDLILTILHVYAPPRWILRSSRHHWLRLIGPGKFLPQVQLERRIAWILAREFELATKGYAECAPGGTTATIGTVLSAQAALLVQRLIYDEDRCKEQEALLIVACQLLQRQGNEAVMQALLQENYIPSAVRKHVAVSLRQVGASNETVVQALPEELRNAASDVRVSTAASLGQPTRKNITVLKKKPLRRIARRSRKRRLWRNAASDVRVSTAASLGQIGTRNEPVDALLEALHNVSWSVRASAAASLGQMKVGSEAVVNALLEALHDTDSLVRASAAASLGQVGGGSEAVVNALLEALHDTARQVRVRVVAILGQVGEGNKTVVNALLKTALHDPDQDVRGHAAASLGQVGVGGDVVVGTLLEALHDPDGLVRKRAAASLGQMEVGSEAVVNALLEALHDPALLMRRSAAASLGQVGGGSEAEVRALLAALHDPDGLVRKSAVASLGRLEIKDTIQLRQVLVALTRYLYVEDNNGRWVALVSIRQLLDGRPIPDYQWGLLRKRWELLRKQQWAILRRILLWKRLLRRLKYIAFRLVFWYFIIAMIAVIVGIIVILVKISIWLLDVFGITVNYLNIRFVGFILVIVFGIIAFSVLGIISSVVEFLEFLDRMSRDPWKHL